ncbi:MAG TPA: hypothetical protein VF303_02115 [Candidatus Nanoarchaeia archaeon]
MISKEISWFTPELQQRLKVIMAEDYGLNLSDSQVREFGENLVQVFNLLYEVDRRQKFEHRPVRIIDQGVKETIEWK